jgi:hypothetical protein
MVSSPSKPRRRWFQFSTLLLLLLTALAASLIAWRQAVNRQQALERTMEIDKLQYELHHSGYSPRHRAEVRNRLKTLQQ